MENAGGAEATLAALRARIDAIRRNHALEHATVAVLLARRGPLRLAGRASADGFAIVGAVDPAGLEDAAREALARLQAGQSGLAISPLCGTNLAAGACLSALAATVALGAWRGGGRFSGAFVAAALAAVAGQPAGRWLQRRLTTRADLDGVEVIGVRSRGGRLHTVRTRVAVRDAAPAGGRA